MQAARTRATVRQQQRAALLAHCAQLPAAAPRWPLYVPSLSRAGVAPTLDALAAARLSHTVVVEPAEAAAYRERHPAARVLPVSRPAQGHGATLQEIMAHARARGEQRYWLLDDDLLGGYHVQGTMSAPVPLATVLARVENAVDAAEHAGRVGLASPAWVRDAVRAHGDISWGRRCYYAVLVRTDASLDYRTELLVKSDVDIVMQFVAAGYRTLLHNRWCYETHPMNRNPAGGGCAGAYAHGAHTRASQTLAALWPGYITLVPKAKGAVGLDVRVAWSKLAADAGAR